MSNITARPTAGNRYKVVRGDSLNNIEKSAYGFIAGAIEPANPFLARRGKSLENRPYIYSGDILNIPDVTQEKQLKSDSTGKKLFNKDKEQVTLLIENIEIRYQSIRIIRTMDTAADGWIAVLDWTPGKNKEIDALFVPYTYPEARVFIGNELLISGVVYGVSPEKSNGGIKIILEGFSYTADIIDSTMPTPYEAKRITLIDRANQLLKNFGIKALLDTGIDGGGRFDRVTGDITDTVFKHLMELAAQRGLLISSTPDGNLLFTRTTDKKTIGTVESDKPGAFTYGAKFDGRLIFNQVKAIGESPGSTSKSATVTDANVPRSRFFTFVADDVTEGEIQKVAEWQRTKQYADALTIPFPVKGFYGPDGKLYRENTKLTVKAPEIFVPDGFDFLIRQVEYVIETTGKTTTLSLVPPEVYTGERIVLPWQVA
jgi:prophage tail gpP-like protein